MTSGFFMNKLNSYLNVTHLRRYHAYDNFSLNIFMPIKIGVLSLLCSHFNWQIEIWPFSHFFFFFGLHNLVKESKTNFHFLTDSTRPFYKRNIMQSKLYISSFKSNKLNTISIWLIKLNIKTIIESQYTYSFVVCRTQGQIHSIFLILFLYLWMIFYIIQSKMQWIV